MESSFTFRITLEMNNYEKWSCAEFYIRTTRKSDFSFDARYTDRIVTFSMTFIRDGIFSPLLSIIDCAS